MWLYREPTALPFPFALQISLVGLVLGEILLKCLGLTERDGGLSLFLVPALFEVFVHLFEHCLLFFSETPVQVGLDVVTCPELNLRVLRGMATSKALNLSLTVRMGTV